jgi:hypothetical protein
VSTSIRTSERTGISGFFGDQSVLSLSIGMSASITIAASTGTRTLS